MEEYKRIAKEFSKLYRSRNPHLLKQFGGVKELENMMKIVDRAGLNSRRLFLTDSYKHFMNFCDQHHIVKTNITNIYTVVAKAIQL